MNKYILPKSTIINNVECEFFSDFRDILDIIIALNDPDLLNQEKINVALQLFYKTDDYKADVMFAISEMFDFISMEENTIDSSQNVKHEKPLYSWEQDYNIIIAPINKILGTDVRSLDYLHWWTFLSAFMEIGESTFNTYVGIRDKLNKNKKLEKYEERILKEHRDSIILKKKYDTTTQSLIDEIMGV